MSSFIEKLMGSVLAISAIVTLHSGFAKMQEPMQETNDPVSYMQQVDEKLDAYHDMVDDLGDIVDAAEKAFGEDEEQTVRRPEEVISGPGPDPDGLEDILSKLGFTLENTDSQEKADATDNAAEPTYTVDDDGNIEIAVQEGEVRDGHSAEGTGAEQIHFAETVDKYLADGVVFEVNKDGERVYPDTGNNSIDQGPMKGDWQSRSETYDQKQVDSYLDPTSENYNPANYERSMAQCRCDAYSEIYSAPYYQLSKEEQAKLTPEETAEMKQTAWDHMSPEARKEMKETNPQRAEILEKNFFDRIESEDGDHYDALEYGYTMQDLDALSKSYDDGYDYANQQYTAEQALDELKQNKEEIENNPSLDYEKDKANLEEVDARELRTGIHRPNDLYPENDGFLGEKTSETLKTGDFFSRYSEKGTPGSDGKFASRAEMGPDGKLNSPSYESRSMVGFEERMQEKFYQVAPAKKLETDPVKPPEAADASDPNQEEPKETVASDGQTEETTSEPDKTKASPAADKTEAVPVEQDQKKETPAGPDNAHQNEKATANPIQPEQSQQEAAYYRLMDYMADHNYGPQDFATYSQDPTWRMLQAEAYPDYEQPPLKHEMTQEEAFNKLQDYMNSHNYGREDFAEYSQDPEWRALEQIAFPDYELPEYRNDSERAMPEFRFEPNRNEKEEEPVNTKETPDMKVPKESAEQETSKETQGETKQEASRETQGETKQEANKETQGETKQEASKETQGETKQEASKETQGETKQEAYKETQGETKQEASKETQGETKQEASKENKTEGDKTAKTEKTNAPHSDFADMKQQPKAEQQKENKKEQSEFGDLQKNDKTEAKGSGEKNKENLKSEFGDMKGNSKPEGSSPEKGGKVPNEFGDMKSADKKADSGEGAKDKKKSEFGDMASKEKADKKDIDKSKAAQADDLKNLKNIDTSDMKTDDKPPEKPPIDGGDSGDGKNIK